MGPPRACLTCGGNKWEKRPRRARHFPRGSAIRRVFDLGKGAQR